MTGLFAAHVGNINAGKTLIWQRYNVLLAANTLLLGFVATRIPTRPLHGLCYCALGVALCCCWFVVSLAGWNHNLRYVQIASRFAWDQTKLGTSMDPNPLSKSYFPAVQRVWGVDGWKRDAIFVGAMIVILLFALAHISLFLGRTI